MPSKPKAPVAKKAAAKSAPKKAPAKKATAKKEAVKKPIKAATPEPSKATGKPTTKKTTPAKKLATKTVTKPSASKSVSSEKTKKSASSASSKVTSTPPAKKSTPSQTSTQPAAPATVLREIKNGVTRPQPHKIGGKLWAIIDGVQANLPKDREPKCPALFEVRKAVKELEDSGGETFDFQSINFNFFQWRKFHGFPARAAGIYPKRGTFEPSEGKPAYVPKAKREVQPELPLVPAAKVATKKAEKPGKSGKVSVPVSASKPGKSSLRKSVKDTAVSSIGQKEPVKPTASSRLKKLSEKASQTPPPADCVIPPVED